MRWRMVLIVVSVVGLVAGSCGDDDAAESDDGPAAPEPEAAVFVWDDDNLNDWVTDDEMADAIADLVPGSTGADVEAGPVEHDEYGYSWEVRVPGEQGWAIHAHPHDGLTATTTDPRLPSGATYGPDWGGYTLSGPYSDEVIGVIVHPPAGVSLSEMDRVFTVGSMMLREMGWAD